jgi:type II restriction/modification system DNA methylase subunit YeeA
MPPLSPTEFAAKWSGNYRPERAAAQEHFTDICEMVGVPTPNAADPSGDWYAFEKGATKTGGEDGFADVWKRGHFAWEYKGKRKDLKAAYKQLLDYREDLENPPLLVVCDLDRFEIHTNFTGTPKQVHRFTLADLAREPSEPMRLLRAVMSAPASLRPTRTRAELTEEAAASFADLAKSLRERGFDPHAVAHFLNKLVFCMFAEDAGLLPAGLLGRLATTTRLSPSAFAQGLAELFGKMAVSGGLFGVERIQWFNGGLFDGADVIPLTTSDIDVVQKVADLDWSEIDASIFGTLFERGLDPDKRSQLGAHYTDRESILKLVEPVLMAPLRREFETLKVRVAELLAAKKKITARTPVDENPHKLVQAFLDRIDAIVVLDPACGSGNFLYVALQSLKDFERDVIAWSAATLKTARPFPRVGPHQLRGIEVNDYAAELARVTIWIGEIQWMLANGFAYHTDPILKPLDNIECRDAILDFGDPAAVREPQWPRADVIVGNPPFLGGKLLRSVLGDAYVDAMFETYDGRVPAEADLVTYWFEKARAALEDGRVRRVGLIATQGIRGGANREVIERIKRSGDIFMAWSDLPWVLDGAAVHVSLIGFDRGQEHERHLDGLRVAEIHSDLSTGVDVTKARRLRENLGIAFMGDTKGGPFDIPLSVAREMLAKRNPDGRSNRGVLRPWVNGKDVTHRSRGMWIIDFGVDMSEREAALYEAPFEYVKRHVKVKREASRSRVNRWWIHERPRVDMRTAVVGLTRFIVTPTLSKHRLFTWQSAETLPDDQLIVIARDDDYTFGVLHSRAHELWALNQGTQLETRPRYTPTTTFETFPFPAPTPEQRERIADAARRLHELRESKLHPPAASPDQLGTLTLTNLYNERPTWLAHAHEELDAAVLDAYGLPHDLDDESLLGKLLELNLIHEPVPSWYPAPRESRDEDLDDESSET